MLNKSESALDHAKLDVKGVMRLNQMGEYVENTMKNDHKRKESMLADLKTRTRPASAIDSALMAYGVRPTAAQMLIKQRKDLKKIKDKRSRGPMQRKTSKKGIQNIQRCLSHEIQTVSKREPLKSAYPRGR